MRWRLSPAAALPPAGRSHAGWRAGAGRSSSSTSTIGAKPRRRSRRYWPRRARRWTCAPTCGTTSTSSACSPSRSRRSGALTSSSTPRRTAPLFSTRTGRGTCVPAARSSASSPQKRSRPGSPACCASAGSRSAGRRREQCSRSSTAGDGGSAEVRQSVSVHSMSATRGPGFVGRTGERDLLDGLLTTVRRGESRTLVIRGEPGVGKTALLRYVARQASGFRIAQIAVVQAEMELPFAAIHQLCAPMLDRLDALPPPQQNALEVAFGLSPGKAPDRFLVAVAALSLLGAVAEERPLLCLVDDAHWLDATSGQVLGFVARRLFAERVGVVFGIREPIEGHALHGLPELRLKGLEDADARALLASAVPGRLDDRIRDRVVAETRGNPLALLELAQGMDSAERAGGFVLPAGGDLPNHLEARYAERIGTLPEPTQRLILLAAADPLGEATLLWRAAERLSIEPSALSPAVEAGLLEIADRV